HDRNPQFPFPFHLPFPLSSSVCNGEGLEERTQRYRRRVRSSAPSPPPTSHRDPPPVATAIVVTSAAAFDRYTSSDALFDPSAEHLLRFPWHPESAGLGFPRFHQSH
ncbi:hypothetical protein Taro_044076, partial [Colocasia esculenta]|nr:hypothetical protein [Colocasia esculenta]